MAAPEVEVVYSVDNAATINGLAQALGYWNAAAQAVESAGRVVAGGAYFLNHAGVVYQPTGEFQTVDGLQTPIMAPLAGEWGRLRIVGQSEFITTLKALVAQTAAPLTLYEWSPTLGAWSADGATPAPDYVATIALIM